MPEPMTDEQFAEIQRCAEREPNADVFALIAEVKWLRFDREQIDTEREAAIDAYNEASQRADAALAALTRHAAEAHGRKWRHDHNDNQAAFDALDRLGNEILASRDRLIAALDRPRSAKRAEKDEAVPSDLIRVAAYVSRGRRFVDVEPYPDGLARRALGALDDDTLRAALAPKETR